MTTTVITVRNSGYDPENEVYIGRPSIWGNPFVIGRDGDRARVIKLYERMLHNSPLLLARVGELRGKKLVCYCAPKACHGDVLARLADNQDPDNEL